MLFDFETFQKLVMRCYEPGPYTLEDVLYVFKYYFWKYEQKFRRPHPHIRMNQIKNIIRVMPYIHQDDIGCYDGDIEVYQYAAIIEAHFDTRYRKCDYNINHFFSGRIRELRYYENW